MGLTVKPGKTPGTYHVGIDDQTKVFIPAHCNSRDEHEYRLFLVVEAKDPDAALHAVTMLLLENKYNTISDPLWAWR